MPNDRTAADQSAALRLRSDDVSWRRVQGEIVILDLRGSVYLSINKSGAVLWDRIVAGTTREELVDLLVTEFAIDHDRALADVNGFAALLAQRGLLA